MGTSTYTISVFIGANRYEGTGTITVKDCSDAGTDAGSEDAGTDASTKAVQRILSSRRWRKLRLDDVARLTLSIAKVRPFICTADWRPTLLTDRADLRALVAPKQQQLELFAA